MGSILGILILAAVLILCLGAVAGIVLLALFMRGKRRKVGYILGIVGCATVPFALAAYFVLAVILLGGIQ